MSEVRIREVKSAGGEGEEVSQSRNVCVDASSSTSIAASSTPAAEVGRSVRTEESLV